jgi:hypothetical protein
MANPETASRSNIMAESSTTSSNNALYFLVGGLVVVVGVIAFMYFGGLAGGHTGRLEISIEAPRK